MAGADGNSWSHEAAARLRIPRLVAADIEMTGDLLRFDGVAVAVAGHAGSGDDSYLSGHCSKTVWTSIVLASGLSKASMTWSSFRIVRYVVFRKADEVRADVDEGIDVGNLPGQGIGLALAQVADHIGLTVEVAGIDGIEVDEVQMADAGPEAR